MKRCIVLAGVGAISLLLVTKVPANIYLDETFEGTTAFVDQDWPVQGDVNIHPTPSIVAVKGAYMRAYFVGSFDWRTPKPAINNTGTLTTARYFLGSKSLQLASGQSVSVPSSPTYVGNANGEYRVIQFALSCTTETLALPAGTVVGHFNYYWSVTTTDTVEATLTLNFRVDSAGKLEMFCVNTSSVVATIDGGVGSWALVSLLTQIRPGDIGTVSWNGYDPLTDTYRNPDAQETEIDGGIHVFVNSNTEALWVLDDQIGTGWGNDNSDTPAATHDSVELGWELAATNGGTLFIDDLYWDGGYHDINGDTPRNTDNEGFAEEEAARMKPFDQAPSEGAPPLLGAKNWEIHQ